jgi:hypothetical protein
MILNTKYRLVKTIVEEIDLITGNTKTISSTNKTKISDIARQLVTLPEEYLKVARMVRWRLNRGFPLKKAIEAAINGGE